MSALAQPAKRFRALALLTRHAVRRREKRSLPRVAILLFLVTADLGPSRCVSPRCQEVWGAGLRGARETSESQNKSNTYIHTDVRRCRGRRQGALGSPSVDQKTSKASHICKDPGFQIGKLPRAASDCQRKRESVCAWLTSCALFREIFAISLNQKLSQAPPSRRRRPH